jgi:hypothetical protein
MIRRNSRLWERRLPAREQRAVSGRQACAGVNRTAPASDLQHNPQRFLFLSK